MTNKFKFALLTVTLLGSVAWFAPMARADEWNKETVLTFNEPVEIPGHILGAGTYVFKLADIQSNRNIVQIFTEDQQRLLATVMATPDYRTEPTGKTVVTFEERAAGSPEALHSWFYPGDNYGLEFNYSKSSQEYAAPSGQPAAKATPSQPTLTEQTATMDTPPDERAPITVREREFIVAQALPMPAENAPSANTDSESPVLPTTLPQTAGNFAMIPLVGLVLL